MGESAADSNREVVPLLYAEVVVFRLIVRTGLRHAVSLFAGEVKQELAIQARKAAPRFSRLLSGKEDCATGRYRPSMCRVTYRSAFTRLYRPSPPASGWRSEMKRSASAVLPKVPTQMLYRPALSSKLPSVASRVRSGATAAMATRNRAASAASVPDRARAGDPRLPTAEAAIRLHDTQPLVPAYGDGWIRRYRRPNTAREDMAGRSGRIICMTAANAALVMDKPLSPRR